MCDDIKVRLFFQCPEGCDKNKPKYWFHAGDCGGRIYMNGRGDLWCENHPHEKSFISKWSFKCIDKNHRMGFVGWEPAAFLCALGQAAASLYNEGEVKFIGEILASIAKRFKEE